MLRVHRLIVLCLLSLLIGIIPRTSKANDFAVNDNPCPTFGPWPLSYLSWSPDGKWLAVGCQENILLYKDDLNFAFSLHGHTKNVTSLDWKPDSALLISGSNDATIRIWDIKTRSILYIYTGHREAISNVRWSPDGGFIASTSANENSGLNPDLQVFEPLARTYKYDIDTNIYNVEPAPYVDSIAWKPDSKQIAFVGNISGVGIWDLLLNKVFFKIDPVASITDLAWSPTQNKIALGGLSGQLGYIGIWNTDTETFISQFKGHSTWVVSLIWSPDSKYIATGSRDQTIKIWNSSNGQLTDELMLSNPNRFIWPDNINWSPDSKRIAWTLGSHELCIASIDTIRNPKCVKIQNVQEF